MKDKSSLRHRVLRALALTAVALVLCACGGTFAAQSGSRPQHRAPSTHDLEPARSLVRAQAALFMRRFRWGQYSSQWNQLSAAARAIWPSRSARTDMLRKKFGSVPIRSARVGTPALGAQWTSAEDPRLAARLWRVPISVTFRSPGRMRPAGVESTYGDLALYLSVDPARGRAEIVGEGPASIDAPVITPARLPIVSTHVPILMYHLVGPYPSRRGWTDDYGYAIEYGLTVLPSQFAGEMAYLAVHGYHAVSPTRLADALLYALPLPPHPVVLTFDDGRQSPWYYAVPVLRRYGFTAAFFVCSGFVGQVNQTPAHLNVQRYLSWPQVTALAKMGFWVEDHGQKDINPLWDLSLSQLRTEVQQSAQVLSAHTGEPVQFVAYTGALWPFPEASESGPAQRALFSRLTSLGYVGGAVDARVPSTQETSGEIFQLPRVRVSPRESLASFAASLG